MKNKKNKLFILTVLVSILITSNVFATDVKLVINGKPVTTDVAPTIENGRTLVPIRVISENLGKEVKWNPETQQVLIQNEEMIISFQINSKHYKYGDITKELDVAPKIINGRTLVPIRAVAESLNIKVDWDNINRTVVVGDGYVAPSITNATNDNNTNNVINNTTGFKDPNDPAANYSQGRIIGNVKSHKYHLPSGKSYKKVSIKNAVFFDTEQDAINANYVKAKN